MKSIWDSVKNILFKVVTKYGIIVILSSIAMMILPFHIYTTRGSEVYLIVASICILTALFTIIGNFGAIIPVYRRGHRVRGKELEKLRESSITFASVAYPISIILFLVTAVLFLVKLA